MTAGLMTFREVAAALETPGAIGVPVSPATIIIPGVTKYDTREQRTKYRPTTLNGTLYPYRTTTTTFAFAPQRLEGQAGAESLPYVLGMALKGGVVPVSDGGVAPRYRWRYLPTGSAEDAPDLRTLYAKDTAGNFQYPSTFGSNFSLTGRVDEALTYSSDLVGQKENWPAGGMGTPGEIDPFHPFPFSGLAVGQGGLFIDPAGSGVLGATRFPGCLRSFTVNFDSFMYHRCQSQYYTAVHQRGLNPRLQLEMEVNSGANDSLSLLAPYKADTRLLVRLLVVGQQIIRTAPAPTTAPAVVNTVAAGATLAPGDYRTRYTLVTEAGESPWSSEAAPTTIATGEALDFTVPALPAGAIGWNAYISPVGGAVGSETGPQNAVPFAGTTGRISAAYVAKSPAPVVNGATVNDVLQLDYAGQILEPSVIGANNADGVETVTFTLESEPDSQLGGGVLDLSVYNALATLA